MSTAATTNTTGAMDGTLWAMLAGYAARMVAAERRGRAIAIVLAGITVALCLGIPLATAVATTIGWRTSFAALAVLAVVLVAWVRWKVPNLPGDVAAERVPLRRVAALPGIPTVLAVTMLLLLGHQAMYTYLAPLAERAGLGHTSLVLFVFGIATVAGIGIVATRIDRHLRPTLLGRLYPGRRRQPRQREPGHRYADHRLQRRHRRRIHGRRNRPGTRQRQRPTLDRPAHGRRRPSHRQRSTPPRFSHPPPHPLNRPRAPPARPEPAPAARRAVGLVVAATTVRGYCTRGRSALYQNTLLGFGLHGLGHPTMSLLARGYTSGVATAPTVVIPFWLWATRALQQAGVPNRRSLPAAIAVVAGSLALATSPPTTSPHCWMRRSRTS
jgi:Major Facilitator Superfamily